MKQYPDYKYKPRRKPKNALPSSAGTGGLGNLHSSNNLHGAASPTAALNMMTNLQNGSTNQTAAAALAAITNAVASADPSQASNPLSAQNLLNLGQNLNAFNLRDFPVLFPRMNNAVAAALSNVSQVNSSASQANSAIPISSSQQYNAFNSSLLNSSFLNPIYSPAKQSQQLLNTLSSGAQKQRQQTGAPTNGYPATNRTNSPVYPSSSFNSSNSTPTLTNSSNLLGLSSNQDAYLAALHQQFLLTQQQQQQQQFLLNSANGQSQAQYTADANEALSAYLNNSNLNNSNPLKTANSSSLSIDNLTANLTSSLTKKQAMNGEQANGKPQNKSHDGSDDETIEESLEDEDADYNEEISSLMEKRKDSGSGKEQNGVQKKNSTGSVNYLKRSIDSVLNERLIDNNNNSNNDRKSSDQSEPPSKHFKGLNEQFESNDLKLNSSLNSSLADSLANNLTTNLFNSLQRTYNLSPTLMLDNVKRFFSCLPTSTSPIGSLAGSKTAFAENQLAKSLSTPNGNSSFSAAANGELANQTANNQAANPAANFLSNLKPRLLDDIYYDNASANAGNFLEFYSQLLLKQANGRTNSSDNFDLHKKSSSLIL